MNSMSINFTSYIQIILKNLKEKLGEDYTVFSKSVKKNNGIVCTGIIAKRKGQSVSPVIYIDDFYREDITDTEIKEISDILYGDFHKADIEKVIDLSDFSIFEKAKKRIAYKLVSAEKNNELLKKVPHKKFYNLAIVFYYTMPETVLGGNATILIRDCHMKQWGVGVKELYEVAFANTPVLFPGVIESMDKIMQDVLAGNSGAEITDRKNNESAVYDSEDGNWLKELQNGLDDEGFCGDKIPMYVLTNRQKIYGAACMLYPGLIHEFAEKMTLDFYILPSSVHEVILVPAGVDADKESLREIVTDINRTQVMEGEVLSDSVYYYNRSRDKILWLS